MLLSARVRISAQARPEGRPRPLRSAPASERAPLPPGLLPGRAPGDSRPSGGPLRAAAFPFLRPRPRGTHRVPQNLQLLWPPPSPPAQRQGVHTGPGPSPPSLSSPQAARCRCRPTPSSPTCPKGANEGLGAGRRKEPLRPGGPRRQAGVAEARALRRRG